MELIKKDSFTYKHINITEYDFSNGLKCIFMPDSSVPVFASHSWFKVGSRNEREGITGIAHFFEHLMFKETKNFGEGQFDKILEQEGGSINAGTYLDWTYYRQCLPKEALDISVKLEADRMENVILNDKQLNSEREVVANERRFRIDNSPQGTMYETLYKMSFEQHPYNWPIIGWMKDIKAINLDDCMTFYKKFYAPNNACLVFVGDIEEKDLLDKINTYYGHMQASKIEEYKAPIEAKQNKARFKEIELTLSSPKFMIAHHAPAMTHDDYIPLSVLMSLLFDGKSSRLHKKLVSEMNLCTSCSAWVDQTMDPGLIHANFTFKDHEDYKKVEKIFYDEIALLQKELVEKEELEKVINSVEMSFWGNFATADDKAQNIGFYQTVFGNFRELFMEMDKLNACSAEAIQNVAKKYFDLTGQNALFAKPKK